MRKALYFSFLSVGILAPNLFCQVAPSDHPVPSAGSTGVDELKTLKERIAQQSEQIKKLQQAVDAQQKLLDEAVSAAETVRAQPQTRLRLWSTQALRVRLRSL